jgi:tetratricopeptide (TPR) repeat protein
MTERQEYTERSFSIRSQMWMATARMIIANPWTGVGAGAWEVQIPLYQRNSTTVETDYYAHNEWLQLLSEYGLLVGGLVIAFLFAYLMMATVKTWNFHGSDLAEAPLRVTALASLLALLTVSNAGFSWHLAACGALLALCLAVLASSDARLGLGETFFAKHLHWRPLLSQGILLFLLCCTVLAAYVTQQAMMAERYIVRGVHLSNAAVKSRAAGGSQSAQDKEQMLQSIRAGIGINPHYRRLTALVAEPLSAEGDWKNATWILESVAASRPHIVGIWSALASGYSQMGQLPRAMQALQQVKRLRPKTIETRTLEISVLSRADQDGEATRLLNTYYDEGVYSHDMVEMGYAIGYKTHNWPLAIRSLELRNQTWPEQAADAHMRLGKIFAEPAVHDDARAIAAFRQGLESVPPEQQNRYRLEVPLPYRSAL